MPEPFETTITICTDDIPVMLESKHHVTGETRTSWLSFASVDIEISVRQDHYGDVVWELNSVTTDSGYVIGRGQCEPIEKRIIAAVEKELTSNRALRQRVEDAVDICLPPRGWRHEDRHLQHERL